MPRYDDAQYQATKQVVVPTSVTDVGGSKFALVNAAILKNARAVVIVAGTSAGLLGADAGHGYSIVVGTNTAGVIVTGSDAAGVALGPFSLNNTVVPAGTPIRVLHGTETTGSFTVTIEYTDQPA